MKIFRECLFRVCIVKISHALSMHLMSFIRKPRFKRSFISSGNILAIGQGKVLFDLWPVERKSHSSVISKPPLPQYIYLDGSMHAHDRMNAMTLQRVHADIGMHHEPHE